MQEADELAIYYEDSRVGRVGTDGSGRMTFRYLDQWLNKNGAFPLSVSMPLSETQFTDETIAPWLANLLPEGDQLRDLSKIFGVSVADPITILRRIGGDTAGAISIDAPSPRKDWGYAPLVDHYQSGDELEALSLHFTDLGKRPFLAGEDGVRLSLAGGHRKTVLAVLDPDGRPKLGLPEKHDRLAIPKNGAPSTIIIKPGNDFLPGLVSNECYCLALAEQIGIPAVRVSVAPVGTNQALIVERYDRTNRNDGTIRRLHQEDFAQASGFFPSQKYEKSERGFAPGPSLVDIARTGDRLDPKSRLQLLDQVIFNILAANADAHAKNYSLLHSGGLRLAPLYDVSTVLLWKNFINQYHAQKIAGKKIKPQDIAPRHWAHIANETGMNPRQLRRRVSELVDRMVAAKTRTIDIASNRKGAIARIVVEVAELVEQNALRIAGRLHKETRSSRSSGRASN